MLIFWEFSEGRLPKSRKVCHPETMKPLHAWSLGSAASRLGAAGGRFHGLLRPLVRARCPRSQGTAPSLGYQISFNPILISRPVPSTSV
jgi:hypothetical protein